MSTSRLSGLVDTVSHHSPVTSEKSWLDFAVRELSHVAAGKVQGQAVWKHKPAWWDGESSGLIWKNPTTNPKDCKDILRKKLECLVKHLRLEQLIPSKLEEEINRWEQGKVKEIIFSMLCSTALGHFNSLNLTVEDILRRSAESGININPRFLRKLEECHAKYRHLITFFNSVQDSGSSNQTQICSGTPKPTSPKTDHEENSPPGKRAMVTFDTVSSSSSPSLVFDPTPMTSAPFTSLLNSDPSSDVNSDFKHAGHSSAVTALVSQQIDIHNKPEIAVTQQLPQVSTGVKRKRVLASSLSEPTKKGKVGKSIAMDMTSAPSGSLEQFVGESSSPPAVAPTAAATLASTSSSLSSSSLSSNLTSSTVAIATAAMKSSAIVSSPSSSFSPLSAAAAASSLASSSAFSSSSSVSSPSSSPFNTPMETNNNDDLLKLFECVSVDEILEAVENSQDTTLAPVLSFETFMQDIETDTFSLLLGEFGSEDEVPGQCVNAVSNTFDSSDAGDSS